MSVHVLHTRMLGRPGIIAATAVETTKPPIPVSWPWAPRFVTGGIITQKKLVVAKPADNSLYIFQRYALTHRRASSRTIRVNEADARDAKEN
jgi:hypothetical protein